MRYKVLTWLGYGAFGLVTFLIFLMFNLPFDRIRSFAEIRATQALGLKVEIDELTHSGFGGLHAEGVRMDLGTGADGKALKPVRIDALDLDVSFFNLLFGTPDTDFESELAGGKLNGQVALPKMKGVNAHIEFQDIDLNNLDFTKKALDMGLKGKVSGSIRLEQEPEQPETLSGELSLTFTNLFLSKFAIKDRQGNLMLEWPDTRLGQLTAKIALKSPKRRRPARNDKTTAPTKLTAVAIEIVEFSGKGQDMDQLGITGDVELNLARPAGSFISGSLSLQPNRKWLEENHLNVLFDNVKEFKDAKSGDKYSWRISGPVSKPRLLPNRGIGNTVTAPPAHKSPSSPRASSPSAAPDPIPMEDSQEPEPPGQPVPDPVIEE